MFGVEREQAILQPQGFDQFRRRRNFITLFRHHHMCEHDLVDVTQRRHHMRGLAISEGVEAAAQRFSVNGDCGQLLCLRRRRQARGVTTERRLQRRRVDALQDQTQSGVGRRIRQAPGQTPH